LLDVTGDGRPDALVIRAKGTKAESLAVRLLVVVNGKEVGLDAWYSDYDLIEPPFSRDTTEEVLAAYLRPKYERVLERITTSKEMVSASGLSETGNFNSDSAAFFTTALAVDSVSAMRFLHSLPRKFTAINYSFGYETTATAVWVPEAKRFLLSYACC